MTSPGTLLKSRGLHPKKQLGQSFLSDPSIAQAIIHRSHLLADDLIVEIGAGLGALTIPAAKIVKKVYAIEKDRKLIEILKIELLKNKLANVEIVENDILKVNIEKTAENFPRKIIVLGNVPYNIASLILVQLINSRNTIDRAILMFQKELAQRLTARSGNKNYGRLTVMLNYCSNIKPLLDVEASAFFPKPRVDSQVLEIRFGNEPRYHAFSEDYLFKVIKAAFGKRRKTLKNALVKSELSLDESIILSVLAEAGIDAKRRAETLSVQEFVMLSNGLMEKGGIVNP
jgi:16S rRNA (adenine1518-N6/adenine1519-N6)-dimethyltransferase